jgi:hypothetical protein
MRAIALAFLLAGLGAFAFTGGVAHVGSLLQLVGPLVPASSATLGEHELEEINAMSPEDQAKRLIERTINHYKGAPDEISKRVEGWTGKIKSSKELDGLTGTAYFSNDLRVRAAALEIWLATSGFHKDAETMDALIRDAALADDKRYFRLSNVGILGNRGIEPEKALETLKLYIRDPDPAARSGAINGLGLLGTEGTIAPLLDAFRHDTSFDLRERAACNLADSGMLSRDLRWKAVPEIVRFAQDASLDELTKKWVYQALREITGQGLPSEPGPWLSYLSTKAEAE